MCYVAWKEYFSYFAYIKYHSLHLVKKNFHYASISISYWWSHHATLHTIRRFLMWIQTKSYAFNIQIGQHFNFPFSSESSSFYGVRFVKWKTKLVQVDVKRSRISHHWRYIHYISWFKCLLQNRRQNNSINLTTTTTTTTITTSECFVGQMKY